GVPDGGEDRRHRERLERHERDRRDQPDGQGATFRCPDPVHQVSVRTSTMVEVKRSDAIKRCATVAIDAASRAIRPASARVTELGTPPAIAEARRFVKAAENALATRPS